MSVVYLGKALISNRTDVWKISAKSYSRIFSKLTIQRRLQSDSVSILTDVRKPATRRR